MSDYRNEAERMIADLRGDIEARAEMVTEVMSGLQSKMTVHPLEEVRCEVVEMIETSFRATWTEEKQGLALTTYFSERVGFTTGPEPKMLAVHVDDRAFDADAPIYRVQLLGAVIRSLAAMQTGYQSGEHPTAEYLSCAVDLTRHIQQRTEVGRIPGRFIVDTEAYGLSPFEAYLVAASETETGAMFPCDLEQWTPRVSGAIEATFIADGGPLALVDDDELRGSLTEDETNAIGHLEAEGKKVGDIQIRGILSEAANRLRAVPQ